MAEHMINTRKSTSTVYTIGWVIFKIAIFANKNLWNYKQDSFVSSNYSNKNRNLNIILPFFHLNQIYQRFLYFHLLPDLIINNLLVSN